MRIGVYSQWYDPEPGPASLPGVYARQLAALGHSVRVITGFPNYPTGKLYPGYRGRRPVREQRDGIPVHRVPLVPSHSGSAIGRLANYASFAASAAVLAGRDLASVDALWVYNSPATVGLPLLLRRRVRATPFLLHVQDLWPESVVHSGMLPTGRIGRLAESAVRALVDRIERAASHIAVISPSVATLLSSRGVPAEKISYVANPTEETLFYPRDRRPELRQQFGSESDMVLMYAGSLGHVQALDTIIEALALLRDRPEIKLVIVGSGIAETELRRHVRELKLSSSVWFHGRVPASEIPDLMAAADVQLVSLRADPFLAMTTPSKIPAIMASAQPMLAVLSGDGAELIERSGAGIVCAPGQPADIAAAIAEFADRGPAYWRSAGRSGLDYYRANMSAARSATTIEQLLMRMAKHG